MWDKNVDDWRVPNNRQAQNYYVYPNGDIAYNGHETEMHGHTGSHQFHYNQNMMQAQEEWQTQTHYAMAYPELSTQFQNSHITPEAAPNRKKKQNTAPIASNPNSARNAEYNPTEMLEDAVATLVLMPTKFDRTASELAQKLSKSVLDLGTLSNICGTLLKKCLTDKFLPMAGRFCHYLAQNVKVKLDTSFATLLLDNYMVVHSNHLQMMQRYPETFRQLLQFSTDLYMQFASCKPLPKDKCTSDMTVGAENSLSSLLMQLYNSAVTQCSGIDETITTVLEMLKLSGKLLEESCATSENTDGNQIDSLFTALHSAIDRRAATSYLKESLNGLDRIRASNWHMDESQKSDIFNFEKSSLLSKARPNAIKIVAPPDGDQDKAAPCKQNNIDTSEPKFTEAELEFMNEAINETDIERFSDEPEDEDDQRMPVEIEAAFEEFLNEQEAVLPRLQA